MFLFCHNFSEEEVGSELLVIVFVYMKNFGRRVPVEAMAQCHTFSLSIMRCSQSGSEVSSLVKQRG